MIECVCTKEVLYRQTRQRGIPGWHELTWADVENVKGCYAPWQEPHLILDMSAPLEANILKALTYLK